MRFVHLAVVLFVASQAVAQKPLLDLTAAPQAPAAGSGTGALALADQLAAEAKAITAKSDLPEAALRAGLRRLAQTLIATGEKAGQAGSARVVLGRTLVGALPALDSAIAGATQPHLLLAVEDVNAACTELAGNPDPDLVVRDALAWLAPLVSDIPATGGWIDDRVGTAPEPLSGKLDAWTKLPGVSAEAIAVVRDMEAAAASADAVYRPSALRTRAMLTDAAAAIESPAAWLAEPTRKALGEQFSEAVKLLSARATRGQALEALSRLARLSDVIGRVEMLENSAPTKKIRTAAALAIALPAAQTDPATIDSWIRLLKLASARSEWPDEKTLIRQLRPGWRILVTQAKQSEQHLLQVLPDVLKKPEAMTDPAVLAAVTAHKRAVGDVEGLIAISKVFAAVSNDPDAPPSEPTASPTWVKASDRVLKVCQDYARADRKEAAQTSLRSLITHVQTYGQMPGEADLRLAVKADAGKAERTSIWAKLAGGKDGSLLSEITDRRAGWINAWEKGGMIGSDGERLAATRALMAVMADAGPVVETPGAGKSGPMYAALQQWPGWEIPWTTMASLSAGMSDQIAEATKVLLSGDAGKAAAMAAKIRSDFPIPLLAGRLAREGKARGLTASTKLGAAVQELTSGGPIAARSWMGRWTDQLDDVCRYAEESAAARNLGAKDKADAILKFANQRAREVMEGLER